MNINEGEESDTRLQQLEESQALALSGDYSGAIDLLEKVLEQNTSDVPARRFLANVLELKAFDLTETSPSRLVTSPDFLRAQNILLEILQTHPLDVITLCDLGDHFLSLRAVDQASEFYSKALNAITNDVSPSTWKDEIGDSVNKIGDAIKESRKKREIAVLRNLHTRLSAAVEVPPKV
jgi:tetratricopeptide (TPR) repeat protein